MTPKGYAYGWKNKTSNDIMEEVCQPKPKYLRQVIYGKSRMDIGKILRELCKRKGVKIIEAEAYFDIHMSI